MTDAPRHLSPPEVARRLGVAPRKVVSWITAGQLRAANVSDGPQRPRWRIDPVDLARFLAARQPQPRVATPRRRKQSTLTEYV